MGILSFFGLGGPTIRDRAQALGMQVTEVERLMPTADRFGAESRLEEASCVRYAIARADAGASWELLQRPAGPGEEEVNGYALRRSGALDTGLRRAMEKVTVVCDEEFFEFEATDTEIAIYWEEWGGAEKADEIREWLQSLGGNTAGNV